MLAALFLLPPQGWAAVSLVAIVVAGLVVASLGVACFGVAWAGQPARRRRVEAAQAQHGVLAPELEPQRPPVAQQEKEQAMGRGTGYVVKDISLAAWGRNEINIAETEMRLLYKESDGMVFMDEKSFELLQDFRPSLALKHHKLIRYDLCIRSTRNN